MVRTYRNNRALLKKRKPLKKIYEENNLHYVKKKVEKRTRNFDPEKKEIFLKKFHAKQKRVRKKNLILLLTVILVFAILGALILKMI